MEKVKNTGKRFVRPAGFSLDGLLAGSFGVFSGLKTERVRLRFSPAVAALVRERLWHSSQRIEELPGGGLELNLEVGLSPEVERWVLGWGEAVEVLAPGTLHEAVLEIARRLVRRDSSVAVI